MLITSMVRKLLKDNLQAKNWMHVVIIQQMAVTSTYTLFHSSNFTNHRCAVVMNMLLLLCIGLHDVMALSGKILCTYLNSLGCIHCVGCLTCGLKIVVSRLTRSTSIFLCSSPMTKSKLCVKLGSGYVIITTAPS
jgi:hypothetical protein